jgi:hypothetical protein
MYYAGDVSQNRQQDVQPELGTKSHLEKDTQRRQQDGKDYSDQIHGFTCLSILVPLRAPAIDGKAFFVGSVGSGQAKE